MPLARRRPLRSLAVLALAVACTDRGTTGVRDDGPTDDVHGTDTDRDTDIEARCAPATNGRSGRLTVGGGTYVGYLASDGDLQVWGGILDGEPGIPPPPAGWPDVPRPIRAVSGDGSSKICIIDAQRSLSCLVRGWPGMPYDVPSDDLEGLAGFPGGLCVREVDGVTCVRNAPVGEEALVTLPGRWADLAVGPTPSDPDQFYELTVCGLDAAGTIRCVGPLGTDALEDVACANELAFDDSAVVCWTDAVGRIDCALRHPEHLPEWELERARWIDDLPTSTGWHELALGPSFLCALDAVGSITCWGDSGLPPPPAGTGFLALGAASGTACAVDSTGTPICWWGSEVVVAGPSALTP